MMCEEKVERERERVMDVRVTKESRVGDKTQYVGKIYSRLLCTVLIQMTGPSTMKVINYR